MPGRSTAAVREGDDSAHCIFASAILLDALRTGLDEANVMQALALYAVDDEGAGE
jgi:hypothetical protein